MRNHSPHFVQLPQMLTADFRKSIEFGERNEDGGEYNSRSISQGHNKGIAPVDIVSISQTAGNSLRKSR